MWNRLFKKTVILNCYTTSKNAYDLFKIGYARSMIPDWWKNTPKTCSYGNMFHEEPSIKSCPGFSDLYKKGIMIPLWSDLKIKSSTERYDYQFADQQSFIEYNHPNTMNQFTQEMNVHSLKIVSPWLFDCSHDIDWLYSSPMWNMQTMDIVTVPGVVKFNYPMKSNINLMVRKGLDYNISLDAGTPIAHIIPITDREVKIQCHLISNSEFEEREVTVRPFFFGAYRKYVELKEKQQKKCPFHH